MSSENEQSKDDHFFEKSVFSRFFGYIGGGGPGGNPTLVPASGIGLNPSMAVGDQAGIGQNPLGSGLGVGTPTPNPGAPHPIAPIIRSYPGETVASRPICETKHQWVDSVLRWGTTRESSMVNVLAVGDQAGITPPPALERRWGGEGGIEAG